MISGIVDALQQCQVIDTPGSNQNSEEAANVSRGQQSRSDDVMTNILQQMMQMQDRYVDLTSRLVNQSNQGGGRGGRNGSGNKNNNNNNRDGGANGGRGNGSGRKGRRMFYCWSHGWCFHPGAYCRQRKQGHQPSASVDNQMGGSVEGLPPGYT